MKARCWLKHINVTKTEGELNLTVRDKLHTALSSSEEQFLALVRVTQLHAS